MDVRLARYPEIIIYMLLQISRIYCNDSVSFSFYQSQSVDGELVQIAQMCFDSQTPVCGRIRITAVWHAEMKPHQQPPIPRQP